MGRIYQGNKVETWWRRFHWRVVKREVHQNYKITQSAYVIQRKSFIFGIPLWWATEWCYNDWDWINTNLDEFMFRHDAISVMNSYEDQTTYRKEKITITHTLVAKLSRRR